MSITIENKVALITGANRGIGKAITESFLNHGAKKVYLAVRDVNSTKALEEKYGDKVVTLQADLTNQASINALAEAAKDVDIVVNNAGIAKLASPLSDNAEEALTQEFDVNVFGLLRVANAFAATLESHKGALVQLNSVASIKNFPDLSTYSASKAASYSLTQGLRVKLGEKGVSVLSVHPGPIATDMGAAAGFTEASDVSVVSEGIVSSLKAGDFHLFPDEMAKQFEGAYQSFSDNVVMA
ncbi:SDR family oxidoreductase [Arcticibacterium luteifluviistationis]|uniref:Short-chain dehydrogenase n=1 Tax=Arcticibacterium luteifluviistationis TaxID=1784714 RepID=A0A2Z4GAL2_9BACT|nr:SDR family oxidoreductase [Arcticibacterium luteifluviistationis]AWV98302.1 short-chain dehydrogenase [Arcticibacterium luteifluviistationis]